MLVESKNNLLKEVEDIEKLISRVKNNIRILLFLIKWKMSLEENFCIKMTTESNKLFQFLKFKPTSDP